MVSTDIEKFIEKTVATSTFEILPLAGDASTRKYYRVVFDSQSLVLMSWEPFVNPEQYPFLNVQKHLTSVDSRVPNVVAVAPELGAFY